VLTYVPIQKNLCRQMSEKQYLYVQSKYRHVKTTSRTSNVQTMCRLQHDRIVHNMFVVVAAAAVLLSLLTLALLLLLLMLLMMLLMLLVWLWWLMLLFQICVTLNLHILLEY